MNRKKSSGSLMSRRSFLKAAGAVGMGAGLAARGMPIFARPSYQDTLNLSMWWWADAPEFGSWIEDSINVYQAANPGITIEPLQQATDAVIPAFTTAAAAGEPADIQFLFNGLYHMENVWLGYLDPLNDLISEDVLQASNATPLSIYEGNYYRIGWYPVPLLWEYNKDVWDQAGLDADNPPATWDAWMDACETLKTAGFTPMGGGISDGFWGEWYLGNALTQSLDSAGEAIELFIGDKDFNDPRYYAFWSRLEEMVSNGYMNDDMLSEALFSAIGKVLTGELATTQNVGAVIPSHIAQIGDRVGLMKMPTFGEGAMAAKTITDFQGWGIPTATDHKQEAADFLIFLQSEDRQNAFWEAQHYFPGNANWDASVIDDPVLQQLYDGWMLDYNVYIPDLMPGLFWTDAMFVAAQEIIAGNMTGEQAGEQNASIAQQWRDLNPDLIENYQIYAQGLAEAAASSS